MTEDSSQMVEGFDLRTLNPTEKDLVFILATLSHPVDPLTLRRCLDRIHEAEGRDRDHRGFERALQILDGSRFIERNEAEITLVSDGFGIAFQALDRSGRAPLVVQAIRRATPGPGQAPFFLFTRFEHVIREIRLAFLERDVPTIDEILRAARPQFHRRFEIYPPLVTIGASPFDSNWLATLPRSLDHRLTLETLEFKTRELYPADEVIAHLSQSLDPGPTRPDPILEAFATHLVFRNQLDRALQSLANNERPQADLIRGWVRLIRGDRAGALRAYRAAGAKIRSTRNRRRLYVDEVAGLFYILLLLGDQAEIDPGSSLDPDAEEIEKILSFARDDPQHPHGFIATCLDVLLEWRQAAARWKPKRIENLEVRERRGGLSELILLLILDWTQAMEATRIADRAWDLARRLEGAGLLWLAEETRSLASAGAGPSLRSLCVPLQAWERALLRLETLALTSPEGVETPCEDTRLVWVIDSIDGAYLKIEAREQKRRKSGAWSRGRPVALHRLIQGTSPFTNLGDQDREILKFAGRMFHATRAGFSETWDLDPSGALPAMIGHPLVFSPDDLENPVEVVRKDPALMLREEKGAIRVLTDPDLRTESAVILVQESARRLGVVILDGTHRKIGDIIGAGLTVPRAGRDRLLETVRALCDRLTVHSDIPSLSESRSVPMGSPVPHVLLTPFGNGIKLRIRVRPFGSTGPAFVPGEGGRSVMAVTEGRRVQVLRDLGSELARVADLIAHCPTLLEVQADLDERIIPDPAMCLELLADLRAVEEDVVIEWPEGQAFEIKETVGPERMSVHLRRENDFFAIGAEILVDEDNVIGIKELMGALDSSSGRFIPLANGAFLELTRELKRRLEDLGSVARIRKKGVTIHPLATVALEEFFASAGQIDEDDDVSAWRTRLQSAFTGDVALPSGIEADLRPYQQQGILWMLKLSAAGMGACLADDMGLGKTLQALSVIQARATSGPSLVIAPTSVCPGWVEECRKFTPRLRAVALGSGNRRKLIGSLGPGEILIVSYGLLVQEVSRLEKVAFRTVVLDEAQMIKNPSTHRSEAAMRLNGGFRLATTGTPIENHLSELFNIMKFLNPGFLGTFGEFSKRFAIPIEKYKDLRARSRLKRVLRPFILRRTKDEVLDELPPRTEISRRVTLSSRERSLYEAMRRRAVEALEENVESRAGQTRIQVLTEITRLRQACAHSRLILHDAPLSSSKFEALDEILDELIGGEHRALIFSQFVGHLKLLEEHLKIREVTYQYLDGGTSMAERARRVRAFQAGEGTVFLISLKAGGLGLNLTAADYVVHMDPWWNPAAEDQASDRVYRIGQVRPVTVYRLVAADTIEDRIVDLHQSKRELANALLQGTSSTQLSIEDLRALLQDI